MYHGPSGPIAFLVHVVVRRPIVSVIIAALGLNHMISYVNRTPGGPGIHSGSASVLARVEEQLKKEHPEYQQLFPRYEAAFNEARQRRATREHGRELSDKTVEEVLGAFGSGLTARDVRVNDELKEAVEKAYFYELIYRHHTVELATTVYVNKP